MRREAALIAALWLCTTAAASHANDFAEHDFSLRYPAALTRFSRYPDVAGTAGASAGAIWGSSANPAATGWLRLTGFSAQGARVVFDAGTEVNVASASYSFPVKALGAFQPSFAYAWSNRTTTRDGLDFEWDAAFGELQWGARPWADTALGLNVSFARSHLEFGLGDHPLVRSRADTWGLRAGVLHRIAESVRVGLAAGYNVSFDRSRAFDPLSEVALGRTQDTTHQVLLRPGLAWDYARRSRVYLDYEFGSFHNDTGTLRVHRFLAGVDHEIVLWLNGRAGTVLDTRGNAALALGLGIFPSQRVFIDLAWQQNMFPEVEREFGRAQTFGVSVSFAF
jgi:hypothetical protein